MNPHDFNKLLRKPCQYICVQISYKSGDSSKNVLIQDLARYIKEVLAYDDIDQYQMETLPGVWMAKEGKSEDKDKMVRLKENLKFQEKALKHYGSRLRQLGLWKSTYLVLPADDNGRWIPTLGQIKKAFEILGK